MAMSRTQKWKLAAGVACVAALAVAACGRDIGGPAHRTVGADGPLINGARIRGTLMETVSPLTATSYQPAPVRRDFSAVVEHGQARLDGATIALSRGLPRSTSDVEFTDREGRRARLVARASAAGLPPEDFQVYRDGQLLVEVAFRWRHLNGAWVLGERTLTVYDRGRALLHHTRVLDGATLASGGLRLPGLGGPASLAAVLLPQRLEAQWYRCMPEATETVLAASLVSAAAVAFIAAPGPVTWGAVVGAIGVYDAAMGAYFNCVFRIQPTSDQ
jgi:hypothetical protein